MIAESDGVSNSILPNVYWLDKIDMEAFINNLPASTVILFHDSFSSYVLGHNQFPSEFYQKTERYPRIRMLHDYSAAVCPMCLDFTKYEKCQSTIQADCVYKGCISKEMYTDFIGKTSTLPTYTGIFCLSKSTMSRIQKWNVSPENTYLIPPLLDSNYNGSDRNPTAKNLLYASRINRQKGFAHLIKALSKCTDLDWTLTVTGEVEDKSYFLQALRYAYERGIGDRINVKGFVSQQKIQELMQETDLFCFPSIFHETYGFSGAEAILSGIPVVAYAIEGVDEWLEDGVTGFACKTMDIDSMANQLRILMTNAALYQEMQRNCIRKVKENSYSDWNLLPIVRFNC